ncbi:hypothetical protein, partial [Streptomyces sp. NPDC003998]
MPSGGVHVASGGTAPRADDHAPSPAAAPRTDDRVAAGIPVLPSALRIAVSGSGAVRSAKRATSAGAVASFGTRMPWAP